MAETETTETSNQQPKFFRRGDEYESLYANSVYFQPSEWDLKLIFGELDNDPKDGSAFVEQHTAISVPWLQAKLMNYYLTLQVGAYEMMHGEVPVPESLMPVEYPLDPNADEATRKMHDFIENTRRDFFALRKSIPR